MAEGRFDPIAVDINLLLGVPQPMEFTAMITLPSLTPTVAVQRSGAPQKALEAHEILSAIVSNVSIQKGAAMPPDMVIGLMLILAGHTSIHLMWLQPGLGTGVLLHYEYQLNGGAWVSTLTPSAEYTITGLAADTDYSIVIRAVTNVGRGPGSAPLVVHTSAITTSDAPQFLRSNAPGGGMIDLSWIAPDDNGGSAITDYEVEVTDPNGDTLPVDSTSGIGVTHRVRGLRSYQRYGFRVRARNGVGTSDWTKLGVRSACAGIAGSDDIRPAYPVAGP